MLEFFSGILSDLAAFGEVFDFVHLLFVLVGVCQQFLKCSSLGFWRFYYRQFRLEDLFFVGFFGGLVFKRSTISYKNCAGVGLQKGESLRRSRV
jgi:hypothetical protein